MGNDLGVFEAMESAGRLSAEAAATQGFELEKSIDRAIFRAKEKFGAYLANSKSKDDFIERWTEVKPKVIKVIAEVTTPTPGVIRRVGAALRPAKAASTPAEQDRPSSDRKTTEVQRREAANANRDNFDPESARAIEPKDFSRAATTQKTAWSYDKGTHLYTSNDPMQKFACPGCGTEQHIGFSHCAGCDRTWNSWAVRRAGTDKTSSSTYMLMAREIKMRGDQFKLASDGTVKIAESKNDDDEGKGTPFDTSDKGDKDEDDDKKKTSATKEAMPMQPNFGTMPGDNSGAMGSPAPAEQPPTPGAGSAPGDTDRDGDVGGGITEGSPIDQIQDALEGAVDALREVQMLSINPVLAKTASAKVANLRTAMDRFWKLHKDMNYVAGMLAKEANEALAAVHQKSPRVAAEGEFVKGYHAAARNEPLPDETSRPYLEGYIAFHKQADAYSDGANTGGLFRPGGQDESTGSRNDGSYLGDTGLEEDTGLNQTSDAGPFDTSQPAEKAFVRQMDQDNAAGASRGNQGQSTSIQPTGSAKSRR